MSAIDKPALAEAINNACVHTGAGQCCIPCLEHSRMLLDGLLRPLGKMIGQGQVEILREAAGILRGTISGEMPPEWRAFIEQDARALEYLAFGIERNWE